MHCSEFLELYSDYRDGLIADAHTEQRLEEHVWHCRRCMQYDARVTRGVLALKAMSDLEPSRRFKRQLARRLATDGELAENPVTPAPPGVMAGLMLAAAVALLVWDGATRPRDPTAAAAPPPPPPPPAPIAIANPGMPFVSFADLTIPVFPASDREPDLEERALETEALLLR